ncbi:MAG TPA: glycosyl hydrolase [Lapillicoccus sp.]|nr:glycosyl hydrolase [Lapillicoccus sp.]
MLRLPDHWVWDSWVADDGTDYHLFFLMAPRSLRDPGMRHTAARVGHAVSRDLIDWDFRGECFGPSEAGFDDLAIWTGSVVREGDRWRMFYTALSTAGHHIFDQRVGSAVSDDLHDWQRVSPEPALRIDGRWYKTLAHTPSQTTGPDLDGSSETWRDPLVLRDPDGDGWHLFVTARSVDAGRNDDGVIAHASSADLTTWTLGPPLCEPGAGFGQLEVLQNVVVDGRPVLAFTCHPHEQTPERIAEWGEYCTWSVTSPGVLGPWDMSKARPFLPEPDLFAAPVVRMRDGRSVILGFRNLEPKGDPDNLGFEIIDPIPVTLDAEGYLVAR